MVLMGGLLPVISNDTFLSFNNILYLFMQNSLHIDRPCPFSPTKSKRSDSGYYCNRCNKIVIDFRDKSIEEILAAGKNTCGIFQPSQLGAQKKMRFSKSIAFFLLSLLSIIGIQASPLEGKVYRNTISVSKSSQNSEDPKPVKVKKKKRKRYRYNLFRRRLSGAFNF